LVVGNELGCEIEGVHAARPTIARPHPTKFLMADVVLQQLTL
jgi:hypothetical protein